MPLAFYRKYRPKSLEGIIGQEHLVEMLRKGARENKFSHAYILYGPRGTGKTTTARLLAKLVNCLSVDHVRRTGEPCNGCRACQEIDEGRAMDVIEIDAASNRGIDEIRDLKDSIRLSPSSYARKVFIIDEAHMLTSAAFNALLKTLEEPPEHAMIILATTEYEKIPATVSSRAQRYHFRKLSIAEITHKLKQIVAQENMRVSDAALELIASAAEGALRDAESLLNQVGTLAEAADVESVERMLGTVGSRRVTALANHIVNGDIAAALNDLQDANRAGANVVDLNKELIAYFRRVLAVRFDPKLETAFCNEVTGDVLTAILAHSKAINPEKTIELLKSLIRAYGEMRYSPFPHIPLEIALIENLKK